MRWQQHWMQLPAVARAAEGKFFRNGIYEVRSGKCGRNTHFHLNPELLHRGSGFGLHFFKTLLWPCSWNNRLENLYTGGRDLLF